ncbi:MAG: hypothetical protein JWQ19_2116 [Subtercola sp.]|nr:hypothetical protein [Subtercola sp.]
MAEMLIRKSLGNLADVSSAGTIAKPHDRMPDEMLEIAADLGVDGTEHEARYLTEAHIVRADLVLCMARTHRKAVVELVPRKSRRVFTILEFASIADQHDDRWVDASEVDPSVRFLAMVESFRTRRAQLVQDGLLVDEDIVDPYGRSRSTYEASVNQLVPAVESLVRVMSMTSKPNL